MATKQALASKLQLTVLYTDEAGKKKTRTLNFSSLKADADNANVLTAANALASLQADALDGVKETVQYEITA
ncbi:MAG: DUF1659 domain-containing protein [Megasphaera micronuciformis]|nr:DUF1659 domain-containing protein [Megasphaera micronuciformis]